MPGECEHAQWFYVARQALFARQGGGSVRGNLKWCSHCGAVQAHVDGEENPWIAPASSDLEALTVRRRSVAHV